MTTIADALAPSELAELEQAFRLELAELETPTVSIDDECEALMGFVTSEYLWYSAWLFGVIVDDDVTNLGCLWQPDGVIAFGYYVPDDYDTTFQVVTIDQPPTEAEAWDAKPVSQ